MTPEIRFVDAMWGWEVAPHPYAPRGWRFWLCRWCYGARQFHPRTRWVSLRTTEETMRGRMRRAMIGR